MRGINLFHGVTDSLITSSHYFLSAKYSQKHLAAMDLIRNFEEAKKLKFNEEKYKTATSIDQVRIKYDYMIGSNGNEFE